MSETSFRIANFLKMFSMFIVFGSLIYFYAYVENRLGFVNEAEFWLEKTPKSYIFYTGLGIFALFNLLMSVGLSMFKNAQGYDDKSWLFKNSLHKELHRLVCRIQTDWLELAY